MKHSIGVSLFYEKGIKPGIQRVIWRRPGIRPVPVIAARFFGITLPDENDRHGAGDIWIPQSVNPRRFRQRHQLARVFSSKEGVHQLMSYFRRRS